MDCSTDAALLAAHSGPPNPSLVLLAAAVPPRNPTMTASDERWETVRSRCQLFSDVVEAISHEVEPLLRDAACRQVMHALIRERLALAIRRTLEPFDEVLKLRFEERRVVDNECYYIEVTDLLTGEREEFGWTYGGGKAASRWKVERLLALAGKGVAA
jgi:hypothetical protein